MQARGNGMQGGQLPPTCQESGASIAVCSPLPPICWTRHSGGHKTVADSQPLLSTEESWKQQYFGFLDRIVNELDRRFNQPGLHAMSRRKDIFIAAARGDFAGSEEDVQEAFAAFPLPDVDSSQLHHQLRLLKTLFKDSPTARWPQLLWLKLWFHCLQSHKTCLKTHSWH